MAEATVVRKGVGRDDDFDRVELAEIARVAIVVVLTEFGLDFVDSRNARPGNGCTDELVSPSVGPWLEIGRRETATTVRQRGERHTLRAFQ